MTRYILGIDQGTTLTKAVIFNHDARIVSSSAVENKLYFPQAGWVEQDPQEILEATLKAVGEVFKNSRISPDDIDSIGISNQLMTTIFWNKNTGDAVGRAISWQDNRNLSLGEKLIDTQKDAIEARTGTHIFPNNSGTKIRWLMDQDKSIQRGLARGELLFGTVDTWLIWKLSGGQAHVTDLSNICMSLLFNTHTLNYDDVFLSEFGIPYEILPELHSSSEIYAYTQPDMFFGARLPIAGDAGDQFSAVFGQACYQPGSMLCNMGTGSSLILNTGDRIFSPGYGVDSPVLWAIGGEVVRGIGSWSNTSGAAIQWFRDELGLIHDLAEAEVLAARVPDTLGVYFVPAFAGLGSPHQDSYARGSFFGITQCTTKNHLIRSALEAMAYQMRDSFEAIKSKADMNISEITVGGGSAKNDFLMQFLSDILGIPVIRSIVFESSILGSAFLAGLATGYWESMEETRDLVKVGRRFTPYLSAEQREERYAGWQKAVGRSIGWLKP
jgi:glycerol kinase